MAGWKKKDDKFSATEFELRRNVGPNAFQLHETMLKSDICDLNILCLTVSV